MKALTKYARILFKDLPKVSIFPKNMLIVPQTTFTVLLTFGIFLNLTLSRNEIANTEVGVQANTVNQEVNSFRVVSDAVY